jgi:hypothetical protein
MFKAKKSNFIKTVKTAKFLGKQLSRLKLGQSYYAIVVSTISAISLLKLAFDEISLLMIVIAFPFLLLGAYIVGYFLDRYNINTMDVLKSNELAHRFLTTNDRKNQEFQLLQTEIILEALKAIKEDRELDPKDLLQKYEDYYKKWKPPQEL